MRAGNQSCKPTGFSRGYLTENDYTAVYDKAREIIGCRFLDNVVVQQIAPDVRLVFLVNDNDYAEWGSDPNNVNQIATFLYNGGNKPGHYILGDVVMCWLIDTDDGGEFNGMSELAANRISRGNNERVGPKALELVPKPASIPDLVVKVMSFNTTDELFRHMSGDTTVKSKEEKIISSGNVQEEA